MHSRRFRFRCCSRPCESFPLQITNRQNLLPGLFEQAREAFPEIEVATSVMIGDSLSDIRFGQNLGMRTVFVQGDPTRQGPGAAEAVALADLCAASLLAAVEALLEN